MCTLHTRGNPERVQHRRPRAPAPIVRAHVPRDGPAALLQATRSSIPPSLLPITGGIPLTQTIFLWQSLTMAAIRRFGQTTPILCVCLGHQAIGAVFGGAVVRAGVPMHGKTSTIEHDGRGVFAGVPDPTIALT